MKNSCLIAITACLILSSCDKDEIIENSKIQFVFTHNFDGDLVAKNTFNEIAYKNANGDSLSITKLRYLLSDFILTKDDGGRAIIEDHILIDVTDSMNLSLEVLDKIPTGSYSSLSFTYGFDSLDNTQNYPDLNAASWNWPLSLGSGYHFMQFEGSFVSNDTTKTFAYHNGTAFNKNTNRGEQNFVKVVLPGFEVTDENTTLEIQMNVAEWFKNPNTWDLNTLNIMLMPNYNAQKLMQENASTVFSLGAVQ